MTHKRNVEGLRLNAQRKSQAALNRAKEAISLLSKENRPVNFKSVAETAGISIPFLYQNETLKQRIIDLRQQPATPVHLKVQARANEASKDAVIETLRLRVKESEAENRSLKKQLEVVYGQLLQSGPPAPRSGPEPLSATSDPARHLQLQLDEAEQEKKNLSEVIQRLHQELQLAREKLLTLEQLEREVEFLRKQNQSFVNEKVAGKARPTTPSRLPQPKTKGKSKPTT